MAASDNTNRTKQVHFKTSALNIQTTHSIQRTTQNIHITTTSANTKHAVNKHKHCIVHCNCKHHIMLESRTRARARKQASHRSCLYFPTRRPRALPCEKYEAAAYRQPSRPSLIRRPRAKTRQIRRAHQDGNIIPAACKRPIQSHTSAAASRQYNPEEHHVDVIGSEE